MNEEQTPTCKDANDSLCTCCICLEGMGINNVTRSEKKIEFSWNQRKLCKKRKGNGIAAGRQDKRSNIVIINKSDTRKLECGHVIHETCYKNFKRYVENNNEERGMKCPMCRRNLKMKKSIRREAKKRAKKAVIGTPYVFVVVFAILLF
jgi:hypothetical protein